MSELTNVFGDIANAIRTKNGEVNTYLPSEMSNAILDIPTGGGGDEYKNMLIGVIEGTTTDLNISGAYSVKAYAFVNDTDLINVSLLDVTDIEQNGFCNAKNIRNLYLPNLVNADNYAFKNVWNCTNFYAPNLKKVGYAAFENFANYEAYYNNAIVTLDLPSVEIFNISSEFGYCGFTDIILNNWIQDTLSGGYTFATSPFIRNVYAPNVKNIPGYSFQVCRNLTNMYMPNVERISAYAFYMCDNLKDINYPKLNIIGTYAFEYCNNVTDIYLPMLDHVDSESFYGCVNLVNVYVPNLVNMAQYTFGRCYNLVDVEFENVANVGNYAFINCWNLTNATFHNLNYVCADAFQNCVNLKKIDIYRPVRLGTAFRYCNNFDTLILRGNDVGEVYNDTFNGCSTFNNGNANLYVPSDMISAYESHPNWSVILSAPNVNILPIEGSPYEL